jgi:hypothetical protein
VYPLINNNASLSDAPPDEGFTLYCYTDLIAVDRFLRPVTTLDAESVWQLIGGSDSAPFNCEAAYVATSRTTGFNGLAQLPRTADIGLAAGSTARFSWTTEDQQVRANAWELLKNAHREGVGLRRGEGFGRVMINAPFHVARANQNAFVGADGKFAEESALVAVEVHAATFPNPSARTNLDARTMAAPQTSGQAKARSLAKDCDKLLCVAAARLLWSLSWRENPKSDLDAWVHELKNGQKDYPVPRKPNLTSASLTAFFERVITDAPTHGVPEFFRYTAECLEAESSRQQKEDM